VCSYRIWDADGVVWTQVAPRSHPNERQIHDASNLHPSLEPDLDLCAMAKRLIG
jgi:hypothetical protein